MCEKGLGHHQNTDVGLCEEMVHTMICDCVKRISVVCTTITLMRDCVKRISVVHTMKRSGVVV